MEQKRTAKNLDLEVQETVNLTAVERRDLRSLMDVAFKGDFSESDWLHALGGKHIVVRVNGGIVAHAAVVPREIWIGSRRLNTGYIEAVAVLPALQGKGIGTTAMRATDSVLEQYELGVLSTGKHSFYERLGWERWRGRSWVRGERGETRSEDDDDSIMIKRTRSTQSLSLLLDIVCEDRAGEAW